MTISLEDIGEAYLDLLRMPLSSPERQLHAQKAMCVLCEIIAERTDRSNESVQGSFEAIAAQWSALDHEEQVSPNRGSATKPGDRTLYGFAGR